MRRLLLAGIVLAALASPALIFAEVIGETNKDVSGIAEPILENILEAFKENDYAQYSKDFDDTLKESVSERKFIETDEYFQDSLGDYQSREYLGFVVKGRMSIVLWKARYAKSEDDVVVKLVLSKRGDEYLVTGLWFQ
ncbi:MAG: DUF3887 domain-containing protein [Candidatus Omnitrophica bacterium]|nr:DUF3887 domain-containing protein [Candidatus Omnitrophota bacterium]